MKWIVSIFLVIEYCIGSAVWPPNYGLLSCIHKGPVDSFGYYYLWDFTPLKGKIFTTTFHSEYLGSGQVSYTICEVPVTPQCGHPYSYNSSSLCVEGNRMIDKGGVTFGDYNNATWINNPDSHRPFFGIDAMYGTTAPCGPIALTWTSHVHFICSPDISGDGEMIAPNMGVCNPHFYLFSKYACPHYKQQ